LLKWLGFWVPLPRTFLSRRKELCPDLQARFPPPGDYGWRRDWYPPCSFVSAFPPPSIRVRIAGPSPVFSLPSFSNGVREPRPSLVLSTGRVFLPRIRDFIACAFGRHQRPLLLPFTRWLIEAITRPSSLPEATARKLPLCPF